MLKNNCLFRYITINDKLVIFRWWSRVCY